MYNIQTHNFPRTTYISIKGNVAIAEIGDFYAKNLPKIRNLIETRQIQLAGMPCGLYYGMEETGTISKMAVAIPIIGSVSNLDCEYSIIPIQVTKALLMDYYGPYGNSRAAHKVMELYLKEHKLTATTPLIEQYVTDPSQEPDSSKWLTKIIYLLD